MKPNDKINLEVTAEQVGTEYRVQVNEHPGCDTKAYSRTNIARVARDCVARVEGLPAKKLVVTRVEFI